MGGWKRLGIVVSVIWMIGAPLYFWHSYDAEARKSADDYYERCTKPFTNESGHLSVDDTCLASSDEVMRRFRERPDYGWPAWVLGAAVWLAFGWLAAWGLIATARWVARGFGQPNSAK
jgi:hypothetical protein